MMGRHATWGAPDTYPYGSGDISRAGFNHLIEREPAVAILLSVIALRGGLTRAALRVASAGAVAQTPGCADVVGRHSLAVAGRPGENSPCVLNIM